MSGMEIERKFLVRGNGYRQQAYASDRIKQGYICSGHGRTVRVRLRASSSLPTDSSTPPAETKAFLTIKGPSMDGGLSRYEFEKEINVVEAAHLFQLCEPGIIDKTRFLVRSGNHVFEVDEFYGENEGLVLAEVELGTPDEPFEKPDFIGDEVTGDRRYYNSHLRRYPFQKW